MAKPHRTCQRCHKPESYPEFPHEENWLCLECYETRNCPEIRGNCMRVITCRDKGWCANWAVVCRMCRAGELEGYFAPKNIPLVYRTHTVWPSGGVSG